MATKSPSPRVPKKSAKANRESPQGSASYLVIGETPESPAITIRPSRALAEFEAGRKRDISKGTINRLSAVLQPVPSVLATGATKKAQLYEVVVNGDLVRAADGNGCRGFMIGPRGIKEHARLFKANKVQKVLGATALWQVASTIVAQKHLADISRQLHALSEGTGRLSRFLDTLRKARIEAVHQYLTQMWEVIQGGEMPVHLRKQLEGCERHLIEIQIHLKREFTHNLGRHIAHIEVFGTGQLTNDIGAWMSEQEALAQDFALCVQTRMMAWHVLSLFPGEPQLKYVRRKSIQQAVDELSAMSPAFNNASIIKISTVRAVCNSESTLIQRRKALADRAALTFMRINEARVRIEAGIRATEQSLRKFDAPTRFLVRYEDGVLQGISQVRRATAPTPRRFGCAKTNSEPMD